MLKDITLGQFYPKDSPIHRLDPRVKMLGTLIFIVSLFVADNPATYLWATFFMFLCIGISGVPIRYMMKGLRPILIILILSMSFNLFLTEGTPLVELWRFTITLEGIRVAIYMGIRLVYLIMGSSLMSLTTTPNDLTDGLEKSFRFLKVIHFPVHEIAMMMSIALRFIPILMEEMDKIMKAQKARGADFESGNLFKKIGAAVPLLVPLFISAMRRANDLAQAMEARCYHGGDGRTKLHPLKYHSRDAVAYSILLVYLLIMIAGKILWPMIPMDGTILQWITL